MDRTVSASEKEIVMGKSILLVINHHGFGPFRRALSQMSEVIDVWYDRYKMRRELARWSEQDLHDIGRSWGDITDEVDKPFWRA
jgi:uncharacterized protein YjiS (DUF1127 family)